MQSYDDSLQIKKNVINVKNISLNAPVPDAYHEDVDLDNKEKTASEHHGRVSNKLLIIFTSVVEYGLSFILFSWYKYKIFKSLLFSLFVYYKD